MESEFRRLFSRPIDSLSVGGANVLEFADGTATATWASTFTVVVPMDAGLTMTQESAYAGQWAGTYTAAAGQLAVTSTSNSMTVTITTSINGSASAPSIVPANPWPTAAATYECLGNELTVHHTGTDVVWAFDRINPTG
jgi:hypothetical protein